MKIIEATHYGMCFGVRDAISLAEREAQRGGLTVLGDLVHNPEVVAKLRQSGVAFASHLAEVKGGRVMITAHGASEKRMAEARNLGLEVIEATCPLVHVAHRAVRELVQQGYFPIIIGQKGHVEVRGLTEDLDRCAVVRSEEDIDQLSPQDRFGIAAQTTQPIERVRHLVEYLKTRFPNSEVRWIDTVCQPTKQRQLAAVHLAMQCELVIVVGGFQSNNTRELVATCRRHCPQVFQVEQARELQTDWFLDVKTVGLTAGTSTPDRTIMDVRQRLESIAQECPQPSSLPR